MQLSIDPPTALWHRQLFRLTFEAPGARAVLIRYHNGNSKPWHLRTSRSYRFKRWHWRKSSGTFVNLANAERPVIDLWIFKSWTQRPEHSRIRLNVGRIEVASPYMESLAPEPVLPGKPDFHSSDPVVLPMALHVRESAPGEIGNLRTVPLTIELQRLNEPVLYATEDDLPAAATS